MNEDEVDERVVRTLIQDRDPSRPDPPNPDLSLPVPAKTFATWHIFQKKKLIPEIQSHTFKRKSSTRDTFVTRHRR